MSGRKSPVLDEFGRNIVRANGKPRPELLDAFLQSNLPSPAVRQKAHLSYDAARDSTEFQNHWANTDALDADGANRRDVRHKLIRRSRYENGSNGYYAGILNTHANMVVGVGPTLRMLTSNKQFNQTVEREFYRWIQRIQLRRKLWCMCHALAQDGEAFAVLQTNPGIRRGAQLDVTLIEAEQCQTPYVPSNVAGYIDGIKFDEYGNVEWYDVLPYHPGSQFSGFNNKPARVAPESMLHWFKMERPGAHRGVPSLTSTLNLGASARRMREGTVAAVETACDLNVIAKTTLTADQTADPMRPFSTIPIEKRMLTVLPMGWEAAHFASEHPNAQFSEFNRAILTEQASPIGQPFNVAAKDSSTYSFASGKLDTLCYRAAIDIERHDCNDLVLDPLFRAWFGEWSILESASEFSPAHQWDWPAHPVIDAVAEASARDTKLKNGTLSLRDAMTEDSKDYEDELHVQAEDYFGNSDDESIEKMRAINVLRNTPAHAIEYVAHVAGIQLPQQTPRGIATKDEEVAA